MSITLMIVIFTCGISYFCFQNRTLFEKLKHYPYAEWRNKEWHRLITSGFVHGSWMHLGINMFVFYQFGGIVEKIFNQIFGPSLGSIYFLAIYLLTIIAADIPSLFKEKDNPRYGAIGASGAVSGILFIYVLFAPWALMWLYAIIPIPSIIAAIGFLIYESYAAKKGNDNIDHSAHFYGAILGVLFMVAIYPQVVGIFLDRLSELPF